VLANSCQDFRADLAEQSVECKVLDDLNFSWGLEYPVVFFPGCLFTLGYPVMFSRCTVSENFSQMERFPIFPVFLVVFLYFFDLEYLKL
jgi:hypothetical protein